MWRPARCIRCGRRRISAKRIITDFHSAAEAEAAEENWARQFQKDEVPENLEEITLVCSELGAYPISVDDLEMFAASSVCMPNEEKVRAAPIEHLRLGRIDRTLFRSGLAPSISEAFRKIRARAVSIDGQPVPPEKTGFLAVIPGVFVFRLGRKMKKVILQESIAPSEFKRHIDSCPKCIHMVGSNWDLCSEGQELLRLEPNAEKYL